MISTTITEPLVPHPDNLNYPKMGEAAYSRNQTDYAANCELYFVL